MKRTLAFLAALLLATPAVAQQQIRSDQLKLKSNGGLGGDTAKALGIEVYRNTTGPASPETGGLWCDTNETPCALKMWDGDSWEKVSPSANLTTQADASSLPATPADGQLLFMDSCKCLWIYRSACSCWYRLDSHAATSGPDLVETFGGTVITAPSGAPTVAAAAGGSGTAGTHTCGFTFVNSTGGETTLSPTTTVTLAAADLTYSWTNIGTGGAGTTARRLYCSKTGATSPLYWQGEVADNSTTIASITLADGSFRYRAASVNYSAALPANWAVNNWDASGTGSGGCGSTGSSVWCQTPRLTTYAATGTADTCIRLRRDIATYKSQAFEIRWRVVAASDYVGGLNDAFLQPVSVGGLRNGDDSAAVLYSVALTASAPYGAAALATMGAGYRATAGGSRTAHSAAGIAGPAAAFPFYVVMTSGGSTYYRNYSAFGIHADGPFTGNPQGGSTEATYGTGVFGSGTEPDRFEMCVTSGASGAAVEIDSWSLTQR